MKIVQVNAVYEIRSIGRTTMEMHEWLREHGHDSHVFCLYRDEPEKHIYKVTGYLGHRLTGIHSRLTGLEGYGAKFATKRILSRLDTIDPDIVLLRNLHEDYVNVPMLLDYLGKKNIATIIVLHDLWFLTGHCPYYNILGHEACEKWLTECTGCPTLKVGNSRWFFDRSNKEFNDKRKLLHSIPRLSVVGVSKWTADEARKSPMMSKASSISTIYNWVDSGKFFPRDTNTFRKRLNIKEKEFVILGVSTFWSESKGLKMFMEIAKRYPSSKIVLVGGMAENTSLPDNVIAAGSTNNVDELASYYSMADVFISPSIHETFGKVIAESLSCGTPAIVNNSTAMPELVSDGCGYAVNNNSIDGFCRFIEEIQKNGKSYYSTMCLAKAHMSFDKEKNLRQYISLMNELLNK